MGKFFTTVIVVVSIIGMMFGVGLFNKKTDKRLNDLIVPAEERFIVYDSTYFMVCGQDTIEVDMQVDTTVYSIKGDYLLVDDINKDGLIINRDTLWIVEPKTSSIDTLWIVKEK